MLDNFIYEPPGLEVIITRILGTTAISPYYRKFVKEIEAIKGDRILDYCSGSGEISRLIMKTGLIDKLVYADVSKKWLRTAEKKLKSFTNTQKEYFNNYDYSFGNKEFDKIIVHFVLHDLPSSKYKIIIKNLFGALKENGTLIIREPMGDRHGVDILRLINSLESINELNFSYDFGCILAGNKILDVRCNYKRKGIKR